MQYILGAYSQLPFGSSLDEYEALLSRQLKPLLTMINENPEYKLLFHLSVSEYEYIESKCSELNMLICDLCRRGQMEILTSGYYDIILSLLPAHERSSHVEKTTTFLRKRFSKKPKGLWCYNQLFSPTLVPVAENCGLDYIMLSSYNQMADKTLLNQPFYMDEMGKTTIIFPYDDRFSKETLDFYKGNIDYNKYLQNLTKIAGNLTGAINTIMLNLDQLMSLEDCSEVFSALYSKLGKNCTLPSVYLDQNEIKKTFYYTSAPYGRDISLGNALSINQYILEHPVLYRNFGLLNILRDAIRNCKKNTDERKNLENLFMKASSCGLYIPNNDMNPAIRRFSNKCLCEMETLLSKIPSSYLPIDVVLEASRQVEHIILGKSSICYLNVKGAMLSRINFIPANYDIAMHSGEGIFADSFIDSTTGKETKLSAKIYEVTAIDKKRTEFFGKGPALELKKIPVNITKHFKFRQSIHSVEVEVENLDPKNNLEGLEYCNTIDIALPRALEVKTSEGKILGAEMVTTNAVFINNPACPFTISIGLSEESQISCKNIEQTIKSCLGDKTIYEYTQFKIRRKLSLRPLQVSRLTIGLRIEKRKEVLSKTSKEKNNDTTE